MPTKTMTKPAAEVEPDESTAVAASPSSPPPETEMTRPANVPEAEALIQRLESELHFALPRQERALVSAREATRDGIEHDRLKEAIFTNHRRNNRIIRDLLPEAQSWLRELRREAAAAAEAASLVKLVGDRDLHQALAEANRDVAALESEATDLPEQIRQAAGNADGASIERLRQRQGAIPDLLFASRIVAARLQVATLEAEAAHAHAGQEEAFAEVGLAEQAVKAAEAKLRSARSEHWALREEEREARQEAEARRRWIAAQLAPERPAGPVVRSTWQAGS